jgi:hypothetical protein
MVLSSLGWKGEHEKENEHLDGASSAWIINENLFTFYEKLIINKELYWNIILNLSEHILMTIWNMI